jgi:hypothetical protein
MSYKTARLAAGATSMLFLGATVLLALGGPAAASPTSGISPTLAYSCNIANLVTTTFDLTIAATAPPSVAPGGPVTLTGVQVSTEIPVSVVNKIVDLTGVKHLAGTVTTADFGASKATPATINAAGSGIAFNVQLIKGKSALLIFPAAPESVGPFTAGQSGTVTVSPGNVVIDAVIAGKSYSINCVPPSPLPAAAVLSIPIATTTTTTVPPTTVPTTTAPGVPTTVPSTVPATHTGEPWAGWPYWALDALLGALAFLSLEVAFQRRRRRP